MEEPAQTALPVYLNVTIKGVVIPTWVAIALSAMAIVASVIVLASVVIFRGAAHQLIDSQDRQTREMRILDLHLQDVESVLIRKGLAQRSDFAPREPEGE